jgi:hypothetical protein
MRARASSLRFAVSRDEQLPSLSKQSPRMRIVEDLALTCRIQPEFGFIGFFSHYSDFRREFPCGSRPARGTMTRGGTRRGFNTLLPDGVRVQCSREPPHEPDDIQSKLAAATFQFGGFVIRHADCSCRVVAMANPPNTQSMLAMLAMHA